MDNDGVAFLFSFFHKHASSHVVKPNCVLLNIIGDEF